MQIDLLYSLIVVVQFCLSFIANRILTHTFQVKNVTYLIMLILSMAITSLGYNFLGVYITIYLFASMVWFNYCDFKKMIPSLGVASFVAITTIIADHISSILSPVVSFTGDSQIIVHLILTTFITIFMTIVLNKIIHKYKCKMSDKETHIISFITFFTYTFYLLCIFLGVALGNTPELIQLNLIFFIIYLLGAFITIITYSKSLKKEFQIKQKEVEFASIQKYTLDLETQYNHMRKFKHDYQNILSSLDTFIEEKDIAGLEKYYLNVIQPSTKYMAANKFKLADLSNIYIKEIKGLIASKLMYAQELGIDASLEVENKIMHINLDSLILIRILGIFLDNAIEELVTLNNKTLRVALIDYENTMQIIIENTCRQDIDPLYKLKKIGYSTKGDHRGLGLSNVDDLILEAEKNGYIAFIETKILRNTFTQILTIQNS